MKKPLIYLISLFVFTAGLGAAVLASAAINVESDLNFGGTYSIRNVSGIGVGTSTVSDGVITFSDGTTQSSASTDASELNASAVSAGVFGSNSTKGNYTFQAAADTDPILFVDATNKRVGIGTTSPGGIFEIQEDSVDTYMRHGNTATASTGNQVRFIQTLKTDSMGRSVFELVSSFDNIADASRNSVVQFKIADSGTFGTAMTINGGNVGIGTTSPEAKLDVKAGTTDTEVLRVSSNGGSGSVVGKTYLGLHHWNSGTYPSVRIGAEETDTADYGASLVFQTRSSDADVVPTTKMIITESGNVGIGTTSPQGTLEINGTNYYGLKIGRSSSPNTGVALQLINADGKGGDISYDGDEKMAFRTYSTDDAMVILDGGNVGIGTTGPYTQLSVAGDALIGQDVTTGLSELYVGEQIASDKTLVIEYDHDNNLATLRIGGDASPLGLTIADGGNVGIGTTSPTLGKLQIDASGGANEIAIRDSAPQIEFEDTTSGDEDYWIHVNSDKMYFLWDAGDDGDWDSPYPLYFDQRHSWFGGSVMFDCNNCGSTSAFKGSSNWGDLTIQGRVISGSDNIHLSPPSGSNVIISDDYRAAGGSGGGTAGLIVEGTIKVGSGDTCSFASGGIGSISITSDSVGPGELRVCLGGKALTQYYTCDGGSTEYVGGKTLSTCTSWCDTWSGYGGYCCRFYAPNSACYLYDGNPVSGGGSNNYAAAVPGWYTLAP